MKIIVSLTSYPKRINQVYQVIESMQKQTVLANKIILWLSKEEFPNMNADLPDKLTAIMYAKKLEIRWVNENLKSHKKYYYSLQEFSSDVVITIDDDTYYESTMIETLMKSYAAHPHAISARNVHRVYAHGSEIVPYSIWNYSADEVEDIESMDLCAIGVGAILYPPKCSKLDWFNKEQILCFAENQDDIWLKFQEVRCGIPVVYIKAQYDDTTIVGSQETSLMTTNLRNGNDICVKKLFQLYETEMLVRKWVLELRQVKNMLQYKKHQCIQKIILYEESRVSIFGAGKYARYLLLFIKEYVPQIRVENFLVSDRKGNLEYIDGIRVLEFNELKAESTYTILLGMNKRNIDEIDSLIETFNQNVWVVLDLNAIKQVYEGLTYIREYK